MNGFQVREYQQWSVYQSALEGATEVFKAVDRFPELERQGMALSMVETARSICLLIAEAWFWRQMKSEFATYLSEVAATAAKAQVWVELAIAHRFLEPGQGQELYSLYEEIVGEVSRLADEVASWAMPIEERFEPDEDNWEVE